MDTNGREYAKSVVQAVFKPRKTRNTRKKHEGGGEEGEPRMDTNGHENVRGWRAWARPRGVLQIPVCYLHYADFPERESIHHVDFQEIQPSQSSYAGP